MGVSTDSGATEMPDVQAGVDLRGASSNLTLGKPPPHLAKYYNQRHRLFHYYDDGIQLNESSWYSVTPEKIALHIAERFSGKQVILDLFSGAGGNSIQFALAGAFVIGVEISKENIAIARNNTEVYEVAQYIDFVHADVYEFVPALKDSGILVDGIFLSPPWGGPGYISKDFFDVSIYADIVNLARTVCKDVGILLPRTVDVENIKEHFGKCELEHNYLGDQLKTATVYFGGVVERPKKGFAGNLDDMSEWVMES